jgi:hypothetical protein
MSRLTLLVAICVISMLISPSFSYGVGEAAAPVLLVARSARSFGMGEAGIADDSDLGSALINPAALASLNGVLLTGGRYELIPMLADDVSVLHLLGGGGLQITISESGKLGVGAAIHYAKLDYGKWWETTAEGVPIRQHESDERELGFTVAGGLDVGLVHFGLGVSAKHVKVDLTSGVVVVDDDSLGGEASGWAGDVGLGMKTVVPVGSDLRIVASSAVSYLNFGHDLEFNGKDSEAPLPSLVRAGVGIKIEGPHVGLFESIMQREPRALSAATYLDIEDSRAGPDRARVLWGLEVSVLEALFLRTGYVDDQDGHIEDFTYGVGLGGQISYFMARIDYARRPLADDLGHEDKWGAVIGLVL